MAQGELDWVELYWSLIQRNGDRFARIIDLLGRPGTLPVLIHCTGGRDRTGVTVALIQAAVGVSAANIAEDYALSSPLLELAPVSEFERLFGSFDIPREEIVRAMVTRPDTMHALFARVRGVYGDVDGLLRAIGLDGEALDRLRAAACAQAARRRGITFSLRHSWKRFTSSRSSSAVALPLRGETSSAICLVSEPDRSANLRTLSATDRGWFTGSGAIAVARTTGGRCSRSGSWRRSDRR
jgi:hypothetical protein